MPPALREADFARVRQLRLHRLTQLRDAPGAIADRAFVKLVYGDDPYGHTPIGTEQTLAGLDVDDVRGFHARGIRPSCSTLIAVGDCDHDTILLSVEQHGDRAACHEGYESCFFRVWRDGAWCIVDKRRVDPAKYGPGYGHQSAPAKPAD